ncbi:MAG: hypothetical protein ACON4G_04390 [Candidatus Puniceispirillaceae bacterium]
MESYPRKDKLLAIFFTLAALFIIFVWVPMDTGTGLVEKVRRKYTIGDALAPTVAGVILLIGGMLLWLRPSADKAITRQNLIWMAYLFGVFTASLMLMRYAGPIVAMLMNLDYRPLRATPPWHYIGFLVGGTILIGGLASLVERRLSAHNFVIGFIAALVVALIYDLPFDDLILPPNGDV